MKFTFKHFNDLSTEELYAILQIRAEVFVVEQNCVYNDIDDFDKDAVHQFIKKYGKIVAYSRLLKAGSRFPDCSIGRVIVKKSERGKGFGKRMMEEAKDFMMEEWNATIIKISAQKYLQKFYEELEFEVITKEYLEDGIPHFGMMYKTIKR
ncbi:MAG: GNAT family N-acetyltransferase [Draconibacterium sp.]|nr:GNAT family N-acetyltransferase [Draconibacterium sp.]